MQILSFTKDMDPNSVVEPEPVKKLRLRTVSV